MFGTDEFLLLLPTITCSFGPATSNCLVVKGNTAVAPQWTRCFARQRRHLLLGSWALCLVAGAMMGPKVCWQSGEREASLSHKLHKMLSFHGCR